MNFRLYMRPSDVHLDKELKTDGPADSKIGHGTQKVTFKVLACTYTEVKCATVCLQLGFILGPPV